MSIFIMYFVKSKEEVRRNNLLRTEDSDTPKIRKKRRSKEKRWFNTRIKRNFFFSIRCSIRNTKKIFRFDE